MSNKENKEEEVLNIKQKTFTHYVYIMTAVLILYSLYFLIFVKSTFMFLYLLVGLVVLLFFFFLGKRHSSLEKTIKIFIPTFLFYSLGIIVIFWKYSVASFAWLIPIPIAAFIYFDSKKIIQYSIYIFATFAAFTLIAYNLPPLYEVSITTEQVKISDIFVFISNLIILSLLLYSKLKLNHLEHTATQEIKTKSSSADSAELDEKELLRYSEVFRRIEKLMQEEALFKDSDLNISLVSTRLKVSNSYISRAIKYEGYSNFNAYVNKLRINYVENLIKKTDFEKLTMLYIYTEAGFNSQTTFNRVFKELKGVTPTEYINTYYHIDTTT